jgi:two-component system, cell cycle sensor histidine kinase and response regulator CckA
MKMRRMPQRDRKKPAFHTFLIFYIDNSFAGCFDYLSHGLFFRTHGSLALTHGRPRFLFFGRVMFSTLRKLAPPFHRPLRLRTQLIAVIVAATTPLLAFAVFMIYRVAADERDSFRYGVVERTRTIMSLVDTELKGSITTLEALATSNELDGDDTGDFQGDATRVWQSQSDWTVISLSDGSGLPIIHLPRGHDTEVMGLSDREEIETVVNTGRPIIGDIRRSPLTGEVAAAVRVPVVRRGVIRYVLSALVKTEAVAALISKQNLPDEWVLTVLDAKQRVVTRTLHPEAAVGTVATENLRAALARDDEAWTRGMSLEGEPVYRSHIRSPFSGWTVVMNIPVDAVDAPLRGPTLYVALFGAALLTLAVAGALWIGDDTARSIEALSSVAGDLAAGKYNGPVEDAPPQRIAEVENLRGAFLTARQLIAERDEERDRYERELWRQASLLELSHDAIFVWDWPSRRIEFWNRAAEAIYGYSRSEAVGKRLRDLLHTYHPRGVGYVAGILEKESEWFGELTHTTRDGRRIQVEARLVRSNKLDGKYFVLETVRDISERKRSERRRRIRNAVNSILAISPALVEAAPHLLRVLCDSAQWDCGAVWLVDRATDELACVDVWQTPSKEAPAFAAATREARFARGASLPGRVWATGETIWITALTGSAEFPRTAAAVEEGLRSAFAFPIKVGDDVLGVVECFARETRPEEEELLPTLASIGIQLGYYIERRRAEDALKRLNEQLEARVEERTAELVQSLEQQEKLEEQLRQSQKMEALGTLAGGIAHDFNNILGIILGYAREMRGGGGVDPLGGLDVILDAGERGAKVVKQLLAFARKPSVAPAPIDLNALASNTMTIIRPVFPKTIACAIELDPSLPLVQGDENQLQQSLINICLNARDAMPQGGTLAMRTAREGDRVRLSITDEGVGMDENTRRRMFEPFFTTKQPTGGTGLGLSVVYGIIKAHGGAVEVDSEPGCGTTLNLYFPIPERAETAQPVRDAAPRATRGHGETILVVDDEANLRELICAGAERRGFRALAARDGREALEVYRARRDMIAVVVLDWGLPGLDGTLVFKQLKEMNPAVDVIGISGYLDVDMKERVLDLGVREFLHKPCAPEEIFAAVARLCRGRLRAVPAA